MKSTELIEMSLKEIDGQKLEPQDCIVIFKKEGAMANIFCACS